MKTGPTGCWQPVGLKGNRLRIRLGGRQGYASRRGPTLEAYGSAPATYPVRTASARLPFSGSFPQRCFLWFDAFDPGYGVLRMLFGDVLQLIILPGAMDTTLLHFEFRETGRRQLTGALI